MLISESLSISLFPTGGDDDYHDSFSANSIVRCRRSFRPALGTGIHAMWTVRRTNCAQKLKSQLSLVIISNGVRNVHNISGTITLGRVLMSYRSIFALEPRTIFLLLLPMTRA